MSTESLEKHVCMPQNAKQMLEWIKTRGGLALWRSINLSNPGKTWTTPAKAPDGKPMPKQSWEMGANTDPCPVRVYADGDTIVLSAMLE